MESGTHCLNDWQGAEVEVEDSELVMIVAFNLAIDMAIMKSTNGKVDEKWTT